MTRTSRHLSVFALAAAGVIPWIPAAPHQPPTPRLAPTCRLAHLRVSGADPREGVFFNGVTGSLVGVIRFRNLGEPCSLLGRPRVRLVGGGAPQVHQRQAALPRERRAPDVLPPAFSTRALPHDRSASVEIWWSNWCGPGSTEASGPYMPPTGLEVTLPGGGSAVLRVVHAPRCDQPAEPSRVAVGVFNAAVPQPKPSTALPLRLRFNHPSYRVAAGQTLRYRVKLTSTSPRPFRFRACPIYFEQLGALEWYEIHYLNCVPAGTLAPGTSAAFAMELRVPHTTKRGRYNLLFELGLGTYQPIQTRPPQVVVTR